ncbi:MAG: aldolase/citrate lyase family protein [Clostridiaceae bacterium]|nr:aldolase/citrate lyase family protein [Clostridiaceae bacterium]
MIMRPSRVLRQLRDGKAATCVKLNLADSRNAEIAAMCGFDCIWIDMEHVPNDMSSIENLVRAAKIYDCDVLTRVSRGGYSDYIRPLEADSAGIMVPHIMGLKDAEYVSYYTKFYPIGRRPIDGGNADGKYCLISGADYMAQANADRFVVVQIEDPEPLPELDKICRLPGIDMIFFGPADFSQGIGTPCDWGNPYIDEVRHLIATTARKYGKFAGTIGNLDNHHALIDIGYNFISVGADVVALSQYYKNIVKNISNCDAKIFR